MVQSKITKVRKRDGAIVEFDQEKIREAIFKAVTATNQGDGELSKKLSDKVVQFLSRRFKGEELPGVEQIQDIVEEVLILEDLVDTAKAYILYREQRRRIREASRYTEESVESLDEYIGEIDWQVHENANMAYSLQGLNHYGVSMLIKKYWLNKIYPNEIREAVSSGDMHVHNLDTLATYCNGWDLYDLLTRGFKGVMGKVESSPAKHLRTALGQLVNFFYTLQGECYSKDTQVLTDSGWKYFFEVGKEDRVFTLNNQTNKIELQKPVKFYEFEHKGELYNFKSKKLDLLVTPNHNMVVDQYCPGCKGGNYRRKIVKAKDFNANEHFIPKGGLWEGREEESQYISSLETASQISLVSQELREKVGVAVGKQEFLLPEIEIQQYRNFGSIYETVKIEAKKILMEDWLAFFGFWLAEGSTYFRERKSEGRANAYYEYAVRISQNRGKVAEEFEEVLKRLPFNYNKKTQGKRMEFVITDKQLFSYLRQFGKAGEKFIPAEIKELSTSQLKILFDWMMKGDGYIDNGNIEYSTKSRLLADDFQEVALKLGWGANIYERRKANFRWFDVGISQAKYFRLKPGSIKKVAYNDKVYCLEVPNHTLYVRREGKASWCGNSAGAQAVSSLDTLLAPFIRYDNLNYHQVKQSLQEFLFNMAIPTRVGFQTPFSNVTLDIKPSPTFAKQPVIIGGKPQQETYGEFQEEMNTFNRAFYESLMEGDANQRVFTFPIPTVNITKDFDWDDPNLEPMWKATAKYGVNYFSNFIQSDMSPEDVRSMCLAPKEELLIRNSKKIKRLSIKEVAQKYKAEEFDKEGWADCKKEGGLEVLSLNPKTLKTEWSPVKSFLRVLDREAVELSTEDGKKATFSTKHPIPVFTEDGIIMKWAKDVRKRDYLISLKKAHDNLSKEYQAIGNLTLTEDLAKLLGYFTADGNYLFENRKGYTHYGRPRGLQFTFRTGDNKNLGEIKSLIKKVFGFKTKERQDPRYNTYYLYLYNSELARKLYDAGFQKYGRLPQILFASPASCIKGFLEFHFLGDGYAKRKEIHLNDLDLSRDLVLLYSLIGQPVTYKLRKKSQRIYLQHAKSKVKKINGRLNNPIIAERVPAWMADSRRIAGFNKSKMIGLDTIKKYFADTAKSAQLENSDIYLARVKSASKKVFKGLSEFYDIELEKNHLFLHSLGQISFNCCRLRLSNKELLKRGGGLFGSNPLTGSVGVVTINLPKIGFLAKTKNDFFDRLAKIMDLAKESLEIKRKTLENFMEKGLYPYSKFYLSGVKKMRGKYYGNHFATVGLVGMNETSLNFIGEDMGSQNGRKFAAEVLEFMRNRLVGYQEETDNLYNLEATPAESTAYRLAKKDREKYPDIITAGTKEAPYYTNSSHLPVNYTDDLFEALSLQDETQCKYTGGTVIHCFLGEKISDHKIVPKMIKKIFDNFHLPYITFTPTFSICPVHGYISGEHFTCPKCAIKQPCEVYSRIVGYLRPVEQWNIGKKEEFKARKEYGRYKEVILTDLPEEKAVAQIQPETVKTK